VWTSSATRRQSPPPPPPPPMAFDGGAMPVGAGARGGSTRRLGPTTPTTTRDAPCETDRMA